MTAEKIRLLTRYYQYEQAALTWTANLVERIIDAIKTFKRGK